MKPPVFCAIADDDTGATDIAGMLGSAGVRTLLAINGDASGGTHWDLEGYDAVVLGIGTRALPPGEAYARTRAAVRQMSLYSPRVLAIKYCSTFDSTTEGNIGPSLDAAMDEAGEDFTIALPALPVNGRTTYMGHHFVHQQLLSESSMRHHPLTPMTDSNLVRHLQKQTKRRVGLAQYPVDRQQLDRLRAEGTSIAIVDCVSDVDLERVAKSIAHLRLISGSSALAIKLPDIWQSQGWWWPSGSQALRGSGVGRGFLVVSGSCSTATNRQNEWLMRQGVEAITVDPLELLADVKQHAQAVIMALQQDRPCLLRTASSPADIERVTVEINRRGQSMAEGGRSIAYGLAALVRQAIESILPRGLIIAGGETSTAICRTLGFEAFDVGANIDPGVPICLSQGRLRLQVVLKSGNFGSTDFYSKAIQAIKDLT